MFKLLSIKTHSFLLGLIRDRVTQFFDADREMAATTRQTVQKKIASDRNFAQSLIKF